MSDDFTVVFETHTVQLQEDGGPHSGHLVTLMDNLGGDSWRCVCSCGEAGRIDISKAHE